MVVVTGPIKIDLFLGDPRHEVEEPWTALPATPSTRSTATSGIGLCGLAGRFSAGTTSSSSESWQKMHHHLLGPVGVAAPAATLAAAVDDYLRARARLERHWHMTVAQELGEEVVAGLQRHSLVPR